VRKPAILLLDEATSALDNESERVVQAALDSIMAQQRRTTVTIAHRLSTIRHADKIAVVSGGRVVEEGTYDELMGSGEEGVFFQLARRYEAAAQEDATAASAGGATAPPMLAERSRSSGRGRRRSRSLSTLLTASLSMRSDELTSALERGTEAEAEGEGEEEEAPAEPKPTNVVSRLFAMRSTGDGLLYVLGTLFAAVSGATSIFTSYVFTKLIGIFFNPDPDEIQQQTLLYGSLQLALSTLMVVSSTLETACFGTAGEHLTRTLRARSMRSLLRQEIAFFDDDANSAGELTSFLGANVALVQSLLGERLNTFVKAVMLLAVGIGLMFAVGFWEVTLMILFAALPLLVMIYATLFVVLGLAKGAKAKGKREAVDGAGAMIGEVVTGIRTVASFNAEHRFFREYCARVDAQAALDRRSAVKNAFAAGAAFGMMMFLLAGVFKWSSQVGLWRLHGLTLADVLRVDSDGCVHINFDLFQGMFIPIMVMFGIAPPLSATFANATDATASGNAARRLFTALDRASLLDPTSAGGESGQVVRGAVEVVDVHFAYPAAPAVKVCCGYSLSIGAGQTVALCGPSGSGKSTLVALLERFYDPQGGAITLDGVDIRTLNLRWLRSQLGLVGQEPVLFEGTVGENIAYGKEGASEEEVREAAGLANAHDFVVRLAGGYETQVGLGGGKLSGGQKQRIAIARAIVRRPAVLLLDEATSALDAESEAAVQEALERAMQGRTTLVIAHRLSTVRHADCIVLMHGGAAVEAGTHDELIARPLPAGGAPSYRQLVKLQTAAGGGDT